MTYSTRCSYEKNIMPLSADLAKKTLLFPGHWMSRPPKDYDMQFWWEIKAMISRINNWEEIAGEKIINPIGSSFWNFVSSLSSLINNVFISGHDTTKTGWGTSIGLFIALQLSSFSIAHDDSWWMLSLLHRPPTNPLWVTRTLNQSHIIPLLLHQNIPGIPGTPSNSGVND